MDFRPVAAATAFVLALGAWTVPIPAHAAPVRPASVVEGTIKVDMDGDGHNDTVVITRLVAEEGWDYQYTVTTHKGVTASYINHADFSATWGFEKKAHLDPVKGYELEMPVWTFEPDVGTGWMLEWRALTWRNNSLTTVAAPFDGDGQQFGEWWQSVNMEGTISQRSKSGYYLFTKKHKHYADNFDLVQTGSNRWTGWLVRSVWKGGHWKLFRSKWSVKLTNKQAAKYKTISPILNE